MWTLYDRLDALCKERGIKGGRMCTDLGLSKSLMTDLKNGRKKTVSAITAQKIASYFGVTVGYLLGEEEIKENPPALTEKDKRDIAKDLEQMMAQLDSSDLMFDGDPMSDEARDSIRAALQMGLEIAKVKNKERFTPKKYRKG